MKELKSISFEFLNAKLEIKINLLRIFITGTENVTGNETVTGAKIS